jgi:hypothetical protein
MPQSGIDLASVFQSVTQALAENQQALNQTDEYNQDHGNNMVQTFQTITGALQQKKGSPASTALSYAAKQLSQKTSSSSGKLYAENLAQAAGQFKGKQIDAQGALQLLQTLIGSTQTAQPAQPAAPAGGGDMLGSLLGGLMGGGDTPAQQAPAAGGDLLGSLLGGLMGGGDTPAQQAPAAGGDMLGSLLGGLMGGQNSTPASAQDGLGVDDLLAAGMAYFQAKQGGGSNTQALVQAFLAGSGMGAASHRTQSTQIVVNSFLQALGGLANR